jgi:hypothetical protein
MALLLGTPVTLASDHADGPDVATKPMADINDLYTWMAGANAEYLNLALTVSPFDNGTRSFGPGVKYVFHVGRYMSFPAPSQATPVPVATEESKVICTFESNTQGQCWVINPAGEIVDYVSGDFSATSGKMSPSGLMKVFAGRRSDPFFFNISAFKTVIDAIERVCGSGSATGATKAACPGVLAPANVTAAGCPTAFTNMQVSDLAGILDDQITAPASIVGNCPTDKKDCFADANVMAIVIQLDKTLVTTTDKTLLGVWASTHQ